VSRNLLGNVFLVAAQGRRPVRMIAGLGYEYSYEYGSNPTVERTGGKVTFAASAAVTRPTSGRVRVGKEAVPVCTCPVGMKMKQKATRPPNLTQTEALVFEAKDVDDAQSRVIYNKRAEIRRTFGEKCKVWGLTNCVDESKWGVAQGDDQSFNWRSSPEGQRILDSLGPERGRFMQWLATPQAQNLMRSLQA
jgi:hypothetical protein